MKHTSLINFTRVDTRKDSFSDLAFVHKVVELTQKESEKKISPLVGSVRSSCKNGKRQKWVSWG